jgi:hypothetical protein
MKSYIIDDRTEGYTQIGPIEAKSINEAIKIALSTDFKDFKPQIEIVDKYHAWIVINMPGGAKYEYEIGEIEKDYGEI